MTVFQTERLTLRRLDSGDADFIYALTNDPDWLRWIGDRGIRTREDALAYIENGPVAMYAQVGFGLYAVVPKEGGAPIGMCGLLKRAWLDDADIGFAYLPRFRGAGYALEAAAGTLEYARSTLGIERVLAIVSPGNAASIRLLEKLGMTFERAARAPGEESDVLVYGRSLRGATEASESATLRPPPTPETRS